MNGKLKRHLFDIASSCQAIADFVAGRSLADYERDRLLRSGVRYEMAVIGEAVVRIRKGSPDDLSRIPGWQRIVAFRNLVVHGYDSVEDPIVFAIATRDVPRLHREVMALLRDAEDEQQADCADGDTSHRLGPAADDEEQR